MKYINVRNVLLAVLVALCFDSAYPYSVVSPPNNWRQVTVLQMDTICATQMDNSLWCTNPYGAIKQSIWDLANDLPVRLFSADAHKLIKVSDADPFNSSLSGVWGPRGTYVWCGMSRYGTRHCWGHEQPDNPAGNFFEQLRYAAGVGDGLVSFVRAFYYDNSTFDIYHRWSSFALTNPEGNCGVDDLHNLYCWGYVGIGDGISSLGNLPVLINADGDWSSAYVGGTPDNNYGCALKQNGQRWCWGHNEFGQLGTGDTTQLSTLTLVNDIVPFRFLALGDQYMCGIAINNHLLCTGRNDLGQLGLGDQADRVIFTAVDMQEWSAVTVAPASRAGGAQSLPTDYTCGIVNNARFCWGSNVVGQLGVGVTKEAVFTKPVRGDVLTWTQISTSPYQACGIVSGTSLWCWGIDSPSPQRKDITVVVP